MSDYMKCQGTTKTGAPCEAAALVGRACCYFHDASVADQRQASRRKGGTVRSQKAAVLPEDAPDIALTNVADVMKLLGTTLNAVRKGSIDVKVANCVGYLSGIALRAFEAGAMADRLAVVEKQLAKARE